METIGTRIRSALTRLDKSPKWLSTEVGVSYETVRKWLANEIAPKRARVIDVARALNLSEEELMFGSAGRRAEPRATGTPAPAAEQAEPWPFSTPRADFDKLSPQDKASLDTVVAKFVAGCLAEQPVFARKKKVIEFTGLHPAPAHERRGTK